MKKGILYAALMSGFLAEASDTPNSNFTYALDNVSVVRQVSDAGRKQHSFDLSSYAQTILTLSSNQTFTVHYQKIIKNGFENPLLQISVGSAGSDTGYSGGIGDSNGNQPTPPSFTIKLIDDDLEKGSFTLSGSYDDSHQFYGPGEISIVPHSSYIRTFVYGDNQNNALYEISATIDSLVSLNYAVETLTTISAEQESKFSVSLDNDGDRVAVGYKSDGSNAVVRVYEFNGSDWQQLGTDID